MVNIADLLFELCENEAVYRPDINLVENGLLDSYTLIELLSRIEDEEGIELQLTRIDRSGLHTVRGIEKLIEEAKQKAACSQ